MIKTETIPDVFVSIDPSYKGNAISILTKDKIVTRQFRTEEKIIRFEDCVWGMRDIVRDVASYAPKIFQKGVLLVEIPPLRGIMSPGLFLLDGAIVSHMMNNKYLCYGVSAKTCTSILGIKKSNKSKSKQLINDYKINFTLPLYLEDSKGRKLVTSNDRIKSDNIAESLILMISFSHIMGWGEKIFPKFRNFTQKKLEDISVVEFNRGGTNG